MKHTLPIFAFIFASLTAVTQSYVPETDIDKMKIKPVVPVKAYAFSLDEVALLESPFKDAMEADVGFLKKLEPDRLLSQFRSHAGLEPKAEKYGGWESSGLAGHSLGHYLSACALHYAATKDPEMLDRVNYIVDELSLCQEARKTGYVGAIPNEDSVFLEVSKGNIRSRGFDLNGAWAPWYTIHKIMAGLMDVYMYCDNDKALLVNKGIADWTENILKDLNYEQLQKMLRCEYGGMNEALVNTYALTGEKKYLELSYKFHDNFVMDSLGMEINILPGKHSNTQVPKAIGALRRYQLTGEEADRTIGEFFWKTIVNHHTYAPGGNSNYEYLGPEDELADKLTDNTMETCNTHNMLKLTRHLFALDPEAHYMDFYERALYNHILASQNPDDGMMCYFVPLRMGTKKEFSDTEHSFTCCVGTGMENHVKYGESIFFKSSDGSLYVNLFIPSKLNWKEKDIKVTLQSGLSEGSDRILLSVEPGKKTTFSIYIRKPGWAGEEIVVRVNGKPEKVVLSNSGYIELNRTWKKGDQVELRFPMDVYALSMLDNADRKAFFYGPVLLAGDMGEQEPDPMKGVPVFVTAEKDPNLWLTREGSNSLIFKTQNAGVPGDVSFRPFYTFTDNYYSVYWDMFTPESWKEQQKIYEQEKRDRERLQARTVDIIRLGEMQPERDHDLKGEKTEVGEDHTRKWRRAEPGGYFSFDMKVSSDTEHDLVCTYWGMDNRWRNFDILVDEIVIATEDLNKYKDSKFYDITYEVPTSLTKGKEKVTITFKPHENNQAGPVYGVRLVKKDNT